MCLDIFLTYLMTFYEAYISPQSPTKNDHVIKNDQVILHRAAFTDLNS